MALSQEQIRAEQLERSYLRIRCMLGLGVMAWPHETMIEVTEYKLAAIIEELAKYREHVNGLEAVSRADQGTTES